MYFGLHRELGSSPETRSERADRVAAVLAVCKKRRRFMTDAPLLEYCSPPFSHRITIDSICTIEFCSLPSCCC